MSPRTASPRNSRRSLEGAPPSRSPHQLRWASACCKRPMSPKVWPNRSASLAAPSAPASPRLELGVDVVNGVSDGSEVFKVFVIDAEPHGPLSQLFFQSLDKLDQRQRVGVEVLYERRPFGDRRRIRLQNVGQLVPDQSKHAVAIEGA